MGEKIFKSPKKLSHSEQSPPQIDSSEQTLERSSNKSSTVNPESNLRSHSLENLAQPEKPSAPIQPSIKPKIQQLFRKRLSKNGDMSIKINS